MQSAIVQLYLVIHSMSVSPANVYKADSCHVIVIFLIIVIIINIIVIMFRGIGLTEQKRVKQIGVVLRHVRFSYACWMGERQGQGN